MSSFYTKTEGAFLYGSSHRHVKMGKKRIVLQHKIGRIWLLQNISPYALTSRNYLGLIRTWEIFPDLHKLPSPCNNLSFHWHLNTTKDEGLTVICDYLLSVIVLCGFIADQHKVSVMAAGTAQVVHQEGAVLQTSVPLSRKSHERLFW